jgi:excisionase family DNA binding protein
MSKLLYTRAESAEMLSLSVRTVDRLIATGKLRVRQMGRRMLIHHADLEKFAGKDVVQIRTGDARAAQPFVVRTEAEEMERLAKLG